LIRAGASTFGYDDANNLIDLSGSALTVNAANQHVRFNATTLHYDGAGNFTSEVDPTGEFTYSGTNQLLTGVFGGRRVVDFSYDGIDSTTPRRIVETTLDGATVIHVFGHSAIGPTHVVDDGVRGSYVRAPDGWLVTMRAGNGNLYDLITDYQGSVLALLDPEGNVVGRYIYTPFGAVSASGTAAGDNAFRYRGAYQLLRGAHLVGHRVYNAFWGRFTQPNPASPERISYTFAANDPLNVGNAARTSFWDTLICRPEDIVSAFLFTGGPC
jgi:RHS repeat-associated protein